MSQATEFCAFLSIRYLSPLPMGSAHDWIADNMPPIPEGLVRMRSFHISPDRSMTIILFDNQ